MTPKLGTVPSSSSDVSGGCTMLTLYPRLRRSSATAFQPEPSANAPWTRTMFLGPEPE
jgi:hypothetical protein